MQDTGQINAAWPSHPRPLVRDDLGQGQIPQFAGNVDVEMRKLGNSRGGVKRKVRHIPSCLETVLGQFNCLKFVPVDHDPFSEPPSMMGTQVTSICGGPSPSVHFVRQPSAPSPKCERQGGTPSRTQPPARAQSKGRQGQCPPAPPHPKGIFLRA